jgi:hypothetical protein
VYGVGVGWEMGIWRAVITLNALMDQQGVGAAKMSFIPKRCRNEVYQC